MLKCAKIQLEQWLHIFFYYFKYMKVVFNNKLLILKAQRTDPEHPEQIHFLGDVVAQYGCLLTSTPALYANIL